MINLVTGLPGNGKTLYCLSYVKEMSERENRPVFYSGIANLTLPWTEIEAEKWFECPPGAIVVIDECQRVFRPRTISKDVPEYVSKLETHRHQGIDLFLITQHPMLADTAIRRLAGNHRHVVRTFGTQFATIHEWGSVKDNCDKKAGRSDSVKLRWKFDKKAFDYYKSAELHTVKRNIPLKVWFLAAAPILILGAVLYMKYFTQKQMNGGVVDASQPLQSSASLPQAQGVNSKKVSYKNALEDAKQYVFEQQARIDGLQHTAPKYDDVTVPTRAPVPVGCIASRDRCGCWTQQATPIAMSETMCRDIVKNGFFEDFDREGKGSRDKNDKKNDDIKMARNDIKPDVQPSGQVSVMPYTPPARASGSQPVQPVQQQGVPGDQQSPSVPRVKS